MILLFRILCTLGLNLIHVYKSESISLTFKMPTKDTFYLYTDYSNKLYLLSLRSTRSQNINTYIQIILTRYIYYDNYDN
jgi:hypothetical protein